MPNIEQDDPLGPEDLPIGVKKAIVDGIDYARLATAYLDTIAGKPGVIELADLATLYRSAERSRMEFLARVLIDHDSKAHRAAGYPRFQEYYSGAIGKPVQWPTIRRQIIEVKVALVLAAHGCSALPSQKRSDTLGKIMPRRHWVRFWKEICNLRADGRIGEKAFGRELERYLELNDLGWTPFSNQQELKISYGMRV